MGMAYSVLFVATQAAVEPGYVAIAVSTLFLSNTVGSIIGVACASAIMEEALRGSLENKLRSFGLEKSTRREVRQQRIPSM
jgi:hypothetical protein